MEQLKVLRGLEEAVFEISKWPRDILWTAKKSLWPTSARNYVNQLWEKPEAERFRERISPILFWLIAVVVPFYILLDLKIRQASIHHPFLLHITEQPWPIKLLASSFLIALWPMACAYRVQKHKEPSNRDDLKRLFSIFCLALSPSTWILLLTAVFIVLFQEHAKSIVNVLSVIAWGIGLVFCFIIFHKEASPGIARRFDSAMMYFFYILIFSSITISTFAAITFLAQGKPLENGSSSTQPSIVQ